MTQKILDLLSPGDRVRRHDSLHPDAAPRRGVVTERYRPAPSHSRSREAQEDWWLYAVAWDDQPGQVDRGFFREGLEREPLVLPPVLLPVLLPGVQS